MGTCVGFPPIRRWVWVRFYTNKFVSGANLVPSGFAGPNLVLLNLDSVPVVRVNKTDRFCRNSAESV
jgi:hypothetical protein